MNLIDMHCDTLWKILDLDRAGDLAENNCSVSIPLLRKGGSLAQFFACFVYAPDLEGKTLAQKYDSGYDHVFHMIKFLKEQMETYRTEIRLALTYEDMEKNRAAGYISALLSVEEGGILNGHMERLEKLYEAGVRLLTPMWNYENCIGYPNSRSSEIMERGLKPFGIEVIERMGGLGMIVDVSHASDGTFRDILKYSRFPVVASHSNCRALADHPRNLSDEMIRALAEKGGVGGLNFYGPFLGREKESRIQEMVEHIRHMINVGGSDFPAIGTDFDGFDGLDVVEIEDIGQMELLRQALEREGFGTGQIEKIWSGNILRVLQDIVFPT